MALTHPRQPGRPAVRRGLTFRAGVVLMAAGAFVVYLLVAAVFSSWTRIHRFEGVAGPDLESVMPVVDPTPVTESTVAGTNRLALLITSTDSGWLGMVHGLRSFGIPFRVTTNPAVALRHRVVVVYPAISGRFLAAEDLRALAAHPRHGGCLIGFNVLGGGLEEVFGFEASVPDRGRSEVRLDPAPLPGLSLDHPRERVVRVNVPPSDAAVETWGYRRPRTPPLAIFDDGLAAWTLRPIGEGWASAVGVDLGALTLRGHNNRQEHLARSYVNEYEPTLDVWWRMLRHLYRRVHPLAVHLGTVPFHQPLAVVMTHDIDYNRSLENAIAYAELERSQGIRGTYFIQTKYVRDYSDSIFLDHTAPPFLERLRALGMEIASHSVCHSRQFARFPIGTGTERYPEYRPFVRSVERTRDGTILGELRVSRFLLETLAGSDPVVSFRPGHLANPSELPQLLLATGYRYSSSLTANDALTHLPFQLNRDRGPEAEVPVYEFPVTVEDELNPPMLDRLPHALTLARQLSGYGGLYVVLIHPNVTDQKLEFERQLIRALKPRAWFGSVSDFGQWWTARDQVEVDVEAEDESAVLVRLQAPLRIEGLSLEVPASWQLRSGTPAEVGAAQTNGVVVLRQLRGAATLRFATRP